MYTMPRGDDQRRLRQTSIAPFVSGSRRLNPVKIDKQAPGTRHILASGPPFDTARVSPNMDMLAMLILANQFSDDFR
jgi:hypothetical protein